MAIAFILLVWIFPACIWADNTAMFELGNDLVREQDYFEALVAYETFVKENPEHRLTPAAQWTMANIHAAINEDYETAAELFQRIVNQNPDTEWEISGYDRLGGSFENQEKWEEAAKVYESALRRLSASGEDAATQIRVGTFRRRLLSSYHSIQDYESIILLHEKMLAANPAAPSAAEDQFHLAQAYADINNVEKAAENFALVVDRYPASSYAQRVQSEQADLLTSELAYDWAPFSTFQSAREFARTGRHDEAWSKFDQIIDAQPKTGMAYGAQFQKQLVAYRKSGDAAALIEIISASHNDYPYGLGGVLVERLSYFLEGIVEAQGTLQSDPDNVGAYVQMGACYYQTQAYYSGIDILEKAIANAPDVPNFHNMLGYCYIGAQNYDQAVSTFRKLVEIDPDNPNSYDSMAELYYNMGDTTMAIQFYQKALAADSSFSNSYYMLGRIYQELGRKEKAIEHLQRYLELDPSGYQSQSAHSLLNQLNLAPSENNER